MTTSALQRLEAFNVRIADEAAGDSRTYDRLLAENADEARRLISEAHAELPVMAKHTPAASAYHFINGIRDRLPRV